MWILNHWPCSKLTLVFLAHTNHLTSFSSLLGETEPGCKSHRGSPHQTPSQQLTLQPVTATGLWTSRTSTQPGPTVPLPCHGADTTLRTKLHLPETPQIGVHKEGTRSCNVLLIPSLQFMETGGSTRQKTPHGKSRARKSSMLSWERRGGRCL